MEILALGNHGGTSYKPLCENTTIGLIINTTKILSYYPMIKI